MNNNRLKALIKIFESSSLSRLKLEEEGMTIELEKNLKTNESIKVQQTENTASAVTPVIHPQAEEVNHNTLVKAPLVGTFYEAPAPDQPAFARVGQTVSKGDTLFIIEAMKVMNEITAPIDGKIVSIHVKNGDMVMFDEVILEMA